MDYSIVTLTFKWNFEPLDLEVPLKLNIGELQQKILEALKAISFSRFSKTTGIKIRFKNEILNAENTLEDYGVWDGSYIEILEMED